MFEMCLLAELSIARSTSVRMLTYILMMSVSVRLPNDQAALTRTLGERSSRAVRMVLAVSATNITSCKNREVHKSPLGNKTDNEEISLGLYTYST